MKKSFYPYLLYTLYDRMKNFYLATFKWLLYWMQRVLACSTLFLFFISFTTQLQVAFKWLKSSCFPAFSYSFLMAEEHLPKMMLSTKAWAGTTVIAAIAAKAIKPDNRSIDINGLLALWQSWPGDMWMSLVKHTQLLSICYWAAAKEWAVIFIHQSEA